MKPNVFLRRFWIGSITLLASPLALAAPLYWDIDNATSGAGGATPSGTWATSGSTWSTSSNGTSATSAYTTTSTDDLFFSAGINATGAYTISLTDSQNAQSLTFQDGTATISGTGGVIALGGTGAISVPNSISASALSAIIGSNTNTVIAGSTGLTKTGVGTLTLNGSAVNTFTGGLNVNGGTLAMNFTNLTTPTDLINNGNTLAFGGGSLAVTGNPAGTTNQTLGNVTVNSGGGGLLVNPNGGTDTNIALGSLTATASGGNFLVGSATSSGTGNLAITTTTDKDAAGIYGGRVVFANGTANTGYDWATTATASPGPFTLSAYSGYAALDLTAGADSVNSRITASATMTGSRTTNSLKFENPAASQTFAIGTGNTLTLTSGGLLMTGGNNDMNITGGSITAGDGSAAADLVVHQYNPAQPLAIGLTGTNLGNTPEIGANIVNNGSAAVTLVKNGPGSVRFTGTNTFTGGIFVNQGDVDFGTSSINNNPITFNANSIFYTNGAHATSGSITLNNGCQVTVCNNNSSFTVNANVLGSGGFSAANGGQGAMTLTLNGTGNTFTGPVRFTHNNGTQLCAINVASLPDTDTLGSGNITFGAGTLSSTSQNFSLAATAVAPLTLNNRRFEMAGPQVNQQINNSSAQALTINNDLLVTGSQGKNLQFGGSGTGISTFSGAIGNHPNPTAPGTIPNALRKTASGNTLTLASVEGIVANATITGTFIPSGTTITAVDPLTRVVTLSQNYTAANNSNFNVGVLYTIPGVLNTVSVTKSGTSTWVLSGNSSYTGPTLVSQGVLNIQHANALGSTNTGTSVTSGAALQIQGGITVGAEPLTLNGTGISTNGALRNISGDNTYGGLVTLGSLSRIQSDSGTLTLSNTGTITGPTFGLTVGGAGNTTINSIIGTTTGALLKQGSGTLTLANANTYTGTTTISDGTLKYGASDVIANSSAVTIGSTATAGALDLAGFSDTLGATLTLGSSSTTVGGLQNQIVNTGGGSPVLTVGAAITYNAGAVGFKNGKALISANVDLSAANRNWTVNDSDATSVDLEVSGVISSAAGGGITKLGTGTLFLNNAANTFPAQFLSDAGTVQVTKLDVTGNSSSLGIGATIRLGNNATAILEYLGSADSSTDRQIQIGTNAAGNTGSAAILNNSATGKLTFSTATFNSPVAAVTAARTLTLGGNNTMPNTISGAIVDNDTGTGGTIALTKSDGGTWTLGGANIYTGATTVNGGTLTLGANNVLPDASAVAIGAGTLDASTNTDTAGTLNVTGTATINLGSGGMLAFTNSNGIWSGTLNITGTFVGGSSIRFGTDNTGLSAGQLNVISVNGSGAGTYSLDSNGYLTAAAVSPYTTWSGGAAFGLDANSDGVKNGIAWVLGAADPSVSALGLLPTEDTTSDPDYLIFTYRRLDTAVSAGTVIAATYGSDLAGWTTAVHDGTNIIITTTDNFYSASPGVDKVEVKIKKTLAIDGRLFARLEANQTP